MSSIAFIGTSLTALQPWTASLAAPGLEVSNFAASAKASDWGLAVELPQALAVKPQVVFIEFATNDAYSPYGISLEQAALNTWAIVRAVQAAGAIPVLEIMSEPVGEQAGLRPQLDEYNALYRAIAQATGAKLMDTSGSWGSYIPPDQVHPSLAEDQLVMVPAVQHELGLIGIATGMEG